MRANSPHTWRAYYRRAHPRARQAHRLVIDSVVRKSSSCPRVRRRGGTRPASKYIPRTASCGCGCIVVPDTWALRCGCRRVTAPTCTGAHDCATIRARLLDTSHVVRLRPRTRDVMMGWIWPLCPGPSTVMHRRPLNVRRLLLPPRPQQGPALWRRLYYSARTYARALISVHRAVLLSLLLSHSTPGKIIRRPA
jgi:hypothetical protein